jgi:hypothetical protein
MKGKKFISTVKVIKPIDGILEVGGPYKTEDLKKKFPFLDLDNKEYFETQYYDKFKKGDKVRFVPGESGEFIYSKILSTKKVYYVKDISHEIRNDLIYTKYLIDSRENDGDFVVYEDDLDTAENKWIVSFSKKKSYNKPPIHELDYFTWKNNICGTWKEMFSFDTYNQADMVAKLFAENTIEQIINLVNLGKNITNNGNKIINDKKI